MSDKLAALAAVRDASRQAALYLQGRSEGMTGAELYAEAEYIPDFAAIAAAGNMLERPVGFTCKSSAGRVVRLVQPYDSSIYNEEPEDLPAQWGFAWSKNPADALPFVSLATSPYMTGDCCTEDGKVWRSTVDYNVYAPSAYPSGWEMVTEDAPSGADEPTGSDADSDKAYSGLLEEDDD